MPDKQTDRQRNPQRRYIIIHFSNLNLEENKLFSMFSLSSILCVLIVLFELTRFLEAAFIKIDTQGREKSDVVSVCFIQNRQVDTRKSQWGFPVGGCLQNLHLTISFQVYFAVFKSETIYNQGWLLSLILAFQNCLIDFKL